MRVVDHVAGGVVIGVVELQGLGIGHVLGLPGELGELEHPLAGEEDGALGADVGPGAGGDVAGPGGGDGADGAVAQADGDGGVVVELGHGGDGAGVVAGDGVKAARHGGDELPVVADGLHRHAAGEIRIRAPGGAQVLRVEAEAGAEAGEGDVHRLAEHAGLHQLQHLLVGRAVVVGKAHHDLRVVPVRHGLDLHGVLHGAGHGLFHVQGDVVLEHHLHIVQPLGGRGGDDHVIRLHHIVLDLLIGAAGAAEFLPVDFQALLAHVIDADDLAAEADDGAAVMAGDIAAADHKYLHVVFLPLESLGGGDDVLHRDAVHLQQPLIGGGLAELILDADALDLALAQPRRRARRPRCRDR